MQDSKTLYEKLICVLDNCHDRDYTEALKDESDPSVIALLSPRRSDLISWMPIQSDVSVLEVGGHFGELSQWISEQSRHLVIFCANKEEEEIIRKRCTSETIVVSSSVDAENMIREKKFDRIIFHIPNDFTLAELEGEIQRYYKLLSADGFLILIGDNRKGISQWVERPRDLSDEHDTIQARYYLSEKIGFTPAEVNYILNKICKEGERRLFIPYPDTVFCHDIYTEEHMPALGVNFGNRPDYFQNRIQLHDQSSAMDALIEDGIFEHFIDSFLITVSAKGQRLPDWLNEIQYVHFSDRRRKKFSTETYIFERNAHPVVVKKAHCKESFDYVDAIDKAYRELSSRYINSSFEFNVSKKSEPGYLYLDFIDAGTLSDKLDNLLNADKLEEFIKTIQEYFSAWEKDQSVSMFQPTESFREIFGNITFDTDEPSLEFTDIDCIFDNVYLKKNGKLEIADFEWSFDFPIPWKFVIFRCIHYYLSYRAFRQKKLGNILYEKMNISSSEKEKFLLMEQNFQNYVSGNEVLETDVFHQKRNDQIQTIIKNNADLNNYIQILEEVHQAEENDRVIKRNFSRPEAFMDFGDGMKKIDYSWRMSDDDKFTFIADIPQQAKSLRIDPGSMPGLLSVSLAEADGKPIVWKTVGMYKLQKNLYLGITDDPYMLFSLKKKWTSLKITFRYDFLLTQNAFTERLNQDQFYLEEKNLEKVIQQYSLDKKGSLL